MKTPLYEQHVKLNARMGDFAGWDLPIQYDGIKAEHNRTRTTCSIFDICHMGEFIISGPTAMQDLERLLTQNISSLTIGQCRYGFLLQDDGGVLDDLTCYRRTEDSYMLVVNAGTTTQDAEWIKNHLSSTTDFKDISASTAKIDIQGPSSRTDIENILGHSLPALKYFHSTETQIAGVECILSRTGYTGEWGYEIYLPVTEAERIWKLFVETGDIQPAGLGARDTLRLEMGYPLYGHELSTNRSPLGATAGMFIDFEKDFIGKPALTAEKQQGIKEQLVGFLLKSPRAARAHDKIILNNQEIGEITSGSFSPSLEVAIALGYVNSNQIEPGQTIELQSRNKLLPATAIKSPFYKDGTARKQQQLKYKS